MRKVQRSEVVDYQTYSDDVRDDFRPKVMWQKERRRIDVGEYLTFHFENHDTALYQIQEMMRAETLVKEKDILHEIATYNEMLGGPGEFGCVLLIGITDEEAKPRLLREWIGLPPCLYVKLEDGTKVRATYDERQVGDDRLSSVQYLKFDTQGKVPVAVGADLDVLNAEATLTEEQRAALAEDLADEEGPAGPTS